MNLNIQYITDVNGNKTAVLIPFLQWTQFYEVFQELSQFSSLKDVLHRSLYEVKKICKDEAESITLGNFLHDC